MMVIMKKGHSEEELTAILKRLEETGLSGHTIKGVERTVVGVVGQVYPELADELETMPGVEEIVPLSKPSKLPSRRPPPYGGRGRGERGRKTLAAPRQETGLPIITEVMTVRDIDLVARYADILQIGARNAQNFVLLEEGGRV